MKKLISIIISVMLCFTLFACNGNTNNNNNNNNNNGGGGGNENLKPSPSKLELVLENSTESIDSLTLFILEKQTVIATYSGVEKEDSKTQWASSDPNVVKVGTQGVYKTTGFLTALKAGTATITATNVADQTITKSITVTVTTVELTVTNPTTSSVDLYLSGGDNTMQLNVTASPIKPITYVSTNKSVATVSESGLITAVSEGTATIKAQILSDETIISEKTFTVNVHPSTVYATTSNKFIKINESFDLPFYVGVTGAVNYTSSNPSVAKVENGKVIPLTVGAATITASVGGATASFEVTVVADYLKEVTFTGVTSEYANFYGRTDYSSSYVNFYYGTSGFEVKFYGTELKASLKNLNLNGGYTPQIQALVDGEEVPHVDANAKKVIVNSTKEYTIVSGLPEGEHTVKVLKRTAYARGGTLMDAFGVKSVKTDGMFLQKPDEPQLKIDVYGDSISCGFGNLAEGKDMTSDDTNGLLAYHYQAAEKLGASVNVQAHSGWGVYVFTDGTANSSYQWYKEFNKLRHGRSTLWDFDKYQPDIVVINLGTNDQNGISKGNYKSADFIANYKTMVKGIRQECPNAKFILSYGMMGKNSTVWADIQTTASELTSELGANIVYALGFTNFDTTGGHPDLEPHIKNGDELYNFIKSNNIA